MKIIVIGDVIEDVYYFCSKNKNINESIKESWKINRTVETLGTGGYVANTICSLLMNEEVDIFFYSACEESLTSKILPLPRIQLCNYPTVKRERYYLDNTLRYRIDSHDNLHQNKIWDYRKITESISSNDIIVLSNYNKGYLNNEIISKIIEIGNKNKSHVIINTVELNESYKNSFLIQMSYNDVKKYLYNNNIEESCLKLSKQYNTSFVITSESSKIIYADKNKVYKNKFYKCEDFKCAIGAGDVFISGVAFALYKKEKNIHKIIKMADKYATMSCTYIGTTELINSKMNVKIGEYI